MRLLSQIVMSAKRITRSRSCGALQRSVMETLESRVLLSGNGLLAQYYNGNSFTGAGIIRNDPAVNFSWTNGAPDNSMPVDGYSAQWTGQVVPLYSQTYTFSITAQGGASLNVNGTTLISQLAASSGTWNGTIALTAGTKYSITVQYAEKNATNSGLVLSWSSASQSSQVIPQSQLYSLSDADVATNYAGSSSFNPATGTLTISGGSKTESWMLPYNLGHYVTQTITGDVQIVARITSATANAYAGITVQDGLTSGATGIRVYRTDTGVINSGGYNTIATAASTYWMKIVRIGNTFTAYGSPDGQDWMISPSGTGGVLNTGAALQVGFFAASNVTNSATLESATFDNISITSPHMGFTTSWVGNSGSGIDAVHVANDIKGMYVASDGTIYANSPYDEGGYEAAIYKDGQIVGPLLDTNGALGSLHGWGRSGGFGIAVDSNYIYVGMSQANPGWSQPAYYPEAGHTWYAVRRYSRSTLRVAPFTNGAGSDNSMLIVDTDGGHLQGMWASGGNLYVSDTSANLIKVYDTATLTLQYSFAVTKPQQIIEDGSGILWILSNPSNGNASILSYSKAGVLQSKSITDVPFATSVYYNPANGELLVADDGASQQIIRYNISGTTPARAGTLGDYGGISSGTPGQVTATKFDNPMAVGADASGNIIVTFNGMHPSILSAIGTGLVIRSFTPAATLNWELHGLEFVDCAVLDPTSDGTTLFTKDEQWTLDYSTSGTEMGTWVGRTVDELVYTGDGRVTGSDTNILMPVLCGQKFMFVAGQSGVDWNFYKQVPGTNLWKLCGGVGPTSMWRDTNNNATKDSNESFNTNSNALAFPGFVDSQGNFWFSAFYDGVYQSKFLGLDAYGNPLYNPELIKANTSSTPYTQFGRVVYVPETDTMYMIGFTATYPNPGEDPRGAGPLISRYDNWSTSPNLMWQYAMPTDRTMSDVYGGNCVNSIALAGDRLFVSIVGTANCYALDTTTGQLVTILYRGPEIGGQGGWLDQIQSIMAFRRSNGEYVITAEDDLLSKIIIYRVGGITPTNLSANTVGAGQITLSWTDTNTKETGSVLQQSTDGVNFSTIATLPANMTSYGVSGLTTGTTYYFRVKATNAFEDSPYSAPVQVLFATTTAPTNVVATGGSGQVSLTWTDNATTETAYKIDRATDLAFSQGLTTFTLSANQNSYPDSSVLAGATYYYRVYAMNGAANLGYSRTVNAIVNSIAPSAPNGLLVLPASTTSMTITWRDSSNNESGFKVERATDANFTQNLVQTGITMPGVTSFVDYNLATNTTYYYRVRAYNAVGDSAYSLSASAKTLSTPAQLTGTPIGTPNTSYWVGSPASSFDGNFATFPDDQNSNGWVGLDFGSPCAITSVAIAPRATMASRLVWGQFQVSNVADFSTATTIYTNMATLPDNTLTTINVNVAGTWRYARFLTSGGYANVSELQFWGNTVTTVPTAVTLNSGSDTGTPGDSITSLNNSSGQQLGFTVTGTISGASVYVLANGQVIGSAVASGTSTTVTTDGATSLADGTYPITSQQVVPGKLASVLSSSSSITILSVPIAPSSLTATPISQTQINLTWTDNSSNETGFKIERATNSGFTTNLTLVTTTAANVTSYSNTGLTSGTTYYYRVRATSSSGDSANSATANATTQSAGTLPTAPSGLTATTVSQTQVNLTWTDNSNNETGFKVERATDSGFTTNLTLVTTTAANATSYSNTGLTANTLYFYRVRATNATGDSANTTAASATTLPNAPTAPSGLTATAFSSSQINLAWTDNSSTETGFKVERATDSGFTANLTLVTTTAANATSYSNTGLTANTTYYYRVRATNTGGDSANTSTASATTTSSSKLTGTVIGTIASGNPITNAFDGNFTTFVDAPLDTGWAGLDLGSSNTITAVKYAPRSGQESRMVGGYFQVSNIADFSTATTIYTIASAPTAGSLTTQTLSVSGTWQYVRYVSPSGGWVNVSELEFWGTAATGGIAPVAPTSLTATTASTTQINLAWVDNSTNETGFKVERATDSGFTTNLTLVTTTAASATSYNDTGVTSGTRYYYRVRATNATGDSVNSPAVTAIATVSAKQTGTIIDTAGATYSNGPTNAFDSNLSTFVDSNSGSGWIGLNLGNANTALTAIKFAARAGLEFRMQGGYFQVSNVSDFSTATTVYTLTGTPASGALTTVSLNVSGTWQYLRYVSPTGGYVNIAELEFWGYTAVTAPGQVTGLSATAASSSQINLSWTTTSGATSYNLYRATTTGGEGTTPYATGITTNSYSNTGLTANTAYYYTVAAVNAGGTGTQSTESSATTLPNAPAAPSGLSATTISQTQINLAWTDNSSNETGFKVERATDSGFTTNLTLVTTTAANAVSYSNTGLTANTQYYYRVRATNTGGDSANSASANATTLPNAPAAPSGLSATTISQTQINLAWTDNSSNETGFKVERATDSGFTTNLTLVTTTAANATSYSNTGLTAGTQYYYRVRATNTGGDSANSTSANATTLLNAPTGLAATAASTTQINLSWTTLSGATSYSIYRSTTPGGEGSTPIVTGIATTSYSNTGLTAGTTYYYKVAAVNAGGTGTQSSEASAITIPAQATGLTANAVSGTQINLAWTATTGAATYNVYRSTTPGGEGSTPIVTGIATTSYSNTGLNGNTTYYYTVAAVNAGGTGSQSAEASSTTATVKLAGTVVGTLGSASGNPIGNAFDGNLTTFFDAPTGSGWAGLDLGSSNTITTVKYAPRSGQESRMVGGYFQVSNIADFSSATTIFTVASTPSAGSLTTQTVSVSGTWQYVRYVGPSGGYGNVAELEFWGGPASGSTAPVAPTVLTATTASTTQINLAWVDNSGNETGFKVERATDTGFTQNLTLVTTTSANATSYNNTGLTSGTRYYYRVRATNATGDSVNCGAVTALATVSSKQTGTVIATSGATYNGSNVAANAFDGSLSTFVDSTSASGWVGLDLGSAKTITTIKFASRSGLEYRMQGGYFQVSNAADFSTATTIYTLSGDAPPASSLTTVSLNVSGTWRYIRYVSPTGGYVNISEMEVWGF